MKLKILVWDFHMDGPQWMRDNLDSSKYTMVCYLENIDAMLRDTFSCEWDVILCFIPPGQEELRLKFDDIFARLGISRETVIYAMDLEDWVSHWDTGVYLLKGELLKRVELYREKGKKDYTVCTVEGISYIASTSDRVILDWMTLYERNWADEEMQVFYELSRKYYPGDASRRGWFIDIGANIGTTCIYYKKKLDENVDILAFEPEYNNYRVLSANLVLNGLDKTSVEENFGLSERQEQGKLHINPANPGQNSLLMDYGQDAEEIKMISLDEYVSEKGISPDDIKYIWIDTEGYEPVVLQGAVNTLKNGNIPVFMEFNPHLWSCAGLFEKMMEVLSGLYTRYIVIDEILQGEEILHPVDEIWQYQNAPKFFQQDIFLIK